MNVTMSLMFPLVPMLIASTGNRPIVKSVDTILARQPSQVSQMSKKCLSLNGIHLGMEGSLALTFRAKPTIVHRRGSSGTVYSFGALDSDLEIKSGKVNFVRDTILELNGTELSRTGGDLSTLKSLIRLEKVDSESELCWIDSKQILIVYHEKGIVQSFTLSEVGPQKSTRPR